MYISVREPEVGGGSTPVDRMKRRVATTVILLGIVSLLTDVSSEMVNAVLPLYLTAEIGIGLFAYGFVDGVYQGVSAFVRILGGYAGDRAQRPKWVAVFGYGISALSRIAMLWTGTLAAVTAVVTADRLGKGVRTAPRDAMIADASDPSNLGRSFGVHRALDTFGAAAGPMVAFALLWAVPRGYDVIFVVSFAVAMVGVAVLLLFVPNRKVGGGKAGLPLKKLMRAIAGPALRRPLIAAGLLGLLTVGDGFLYLSLQRRDDFAAAMFPLLYVGTNLAYLVLAIPFGRLADRIGRAKVFLGGHVLLLVAYGFAAAPIGGWAWTIASLVLLGAFYAASDGVLAALVSRLVPAESRGTGIASAQTVVALARFASSLLFGALWVGLGRQEALVVVAVALAVAIPVGGWLLRGVER
ncbi:MFS transporter [Virgisporangium ochraceum]|uniref:MFS transporter n=1 Tax=Virgisporangium ochraceum TaxID=65505 RepID=A0A8J3ZQI6_9ACTN|nr:MFS transporter [Virgisporangium ochraceum]